MAKKKRPPGWEKHQEKKRLEKFGPRVTYDQALTKVLEGESDLKALLERMEKNPENFGGWGYTDAEGNDYEFEDIESLKAVVKGAFPLDNGSDN